MEANKALSRKEQKEQIKAVTNHQIRCPICNGNKITREAIENEYFQFIPLKRIAEKYQTTAYNISTHCTMMGIANERIANRKAVLEAIVNKGLDESIITAAVAMEALVTLLKMENLLIPEDSEDKIIVKFETEHWSGKNKNEVDGTFEVVEELKEEKENGKEEITKSAES